MPVIEFSPKPTERQQRFGVLPGVHRFNIAEMSAKEAIETCVAGLPELEGQKWKISAEDGVALKSGDKLIGENVYTLEY